MDIYQLAIRPALFSGLKADPEWLHQQTLHLFSTLAGSPSHPPKSWIVAQLQQSYAKRDVRLEQTLWKLKFPNPVGLAAGFDKDGVAAGIWPSLGFGFAELGTVTLHAQPGNPRPRLFRLPMDKAALNRMGFNNQGAAAMAQRLESWSGKLKAENSNLQPSTFNIPLGINLGKSKITSLEAAAADYLGSFRLLKDLGDYFVVNVSSPNTPGLRSLQSSDQLSLILDALQQENQGQKPLLVKIAPDLEWEAIASVIELAKNYQLAGIIATNTTIRRDHLKTQILSPTGKPVSEEAGGISGAPLRERSTEVIRFIFTQTQGQLPIIGVGGIFTAQDAWEKIAAGASLIQVYTGWIYEGPWMVRRILEGLLQKLQEHSLASLSDAVGIDSLQT
ncbi:MULTISPECIES: quinone-dependent dihydroorotate dehydrogenase [unclassified Coleofasciculus]|uniref:quinone-dependent dihydroorotate dehydrogenase n=1 Tax=Cyanophyceae TaxID=3028117 RepID=UPI0016896302|nr:MULTISPECIES: quinone-dependent dihydroorotate dehydrogenase [unclassified Coleofasciculus]MBD1888010.1 quinone-dependent dihydroorotate dehydrogenase [Coleofasciculus sp. FACHB-SPT9]MBD1894245.1 quinone-dependent dihydroorotate dehydrogenase [Coleofasciculus sp. FACHB-129]